MKILSKTINAPHPYRSGEYENKEFHFILIEDMEDYLEFINHDGPVRAKESVDFWIGFKSQNFRTTPLNYMCHEFNDSLMAPILALQLDTAEEPTSLIKYCENSDDLIKGINESILGFLRGGKVARINSTGGLCSIEKKEIEEYKLSYMDPSKLKQFYGIKSQVR